MEWQKINQLTKRLIGKKKNLASPEADENEDMNRIKFVPR